MSAASTTHAEAQSSTAVFWPPILTIFETTMTAEAVCWQHMELSQGSNASVHAPRLVTGLSTTGDLAGLLQIQHLQLGTPLHDTSPALLMLIAVQVRLQLNLQAGTDTSALRPQACYWSHDTQRRYDLGHSLGWCWTENVTQAVSKVDATDAT